MCRHGSIMHLCGMRLLIQMSFLTSQGICYVYRWITRCGIGRAFKGNFIATVNVSGFLQRSTFSHEWLNKKGNNSQHSPGAWQSIKELTHGILTTAHEASTNPHDAKAQRGKTTRRWMHRKWGGQLGFWPWSLTPELGLFMHSLLSLFSTNFKTIFY